MERLYRTVVQLEEAKRLVKRGDVAHLRLALILLDNAVEVMMYRVVEGKLQHAEMYARMLQNFQGGPLDAQGEELSRDMLSHIVPSNRQKQIRHVFGEKIVFLSDDHDCIPRPSARALRHLHDYRNETQHQDHVRAESIRAAVLVLFDIATDFLVRLHPGTTTWQSGEDYDWLRKYGISKTLHISDEIRPRIAKTLRTGLPLDVAGIRTALIAHLTGRLDAMENQLTFIDENLPTGPDRAKTLKTIQFWHQYPPGRPGKPSVDLHAFVAPCDLESFRRWRVAVEALSLMEDKLEMFDQFATIENEFEPLERMIDDTVSEIDAQIQHAIDVMRGK